MKEMTRAMMKAMAINLFVCGILTAGAAIAQAEDVVDTAGRLKLEGSFLGGEGLKDSEIGSTTSGEKVKISGGGGFGGALTLGYGLSKHIDVELTGGYMKSSMDEVTNANGDFSRGLLLATALYKLPLSKSVQLKFGAGGGIYFGGNMSLDTSQVTDGSKVHIKYDTAPGFHVLSGAEWFASRNWSLSLGAKYTYVKYDVSEVTANGVSCPSSFLRDDLKKLDGSGIDFILGVAYYF